MTVGVVAVSGDDRAAQGALSFGRLLPFPLELGDLVDLLRAHLDDLDELHFVVSSQRCSGLGKSKRQPASHSERWLPWAGMPPASLSIRARCSRFQVMNVVLRLVKSFSGPAEPGSR